MRRLLFVVCCAVFAAASVVSFSTLAAEAQPADQYGSSGGTEAVQDQTESTAPESLPAESTSEPPAPPDNVDEPSAEDLEDRVVNTVPKDPYSQVVDNATPGRFSASGWQKVRDASAYGGSFVRAEAGRRSDARFRLEVPESGYYTMYARWPAKASNTFAARVGVSTAVGVRWEDVDQRTDGSEWVRIGAFEMEQGESRSVLVSAGEGGATIADAVAISKNVLVGKNAQMASVGDPDMLSDDEQADSSGGGARTLSTRSGKVDERRSVVRVARNHLGKGYDYNHRRCERGMAREDCSCLTRNVFINAFGKYLSDSPVYQWDRGKRISKANTKRGDLVFHDLNKDGDLKDHYTDHVSIYSGNGNIIHASSYFGKVVESKERYLDRYWGSRRLNLS